MANLMYKVCVVENAINPAFSMNYTRGKGKTSKDRKLKALENGYLRFYFIFFRPKNKISISSEIRAYNINTFEDIQKAVI